MALRSTSEGRRLTISSLLTQPGGCLTTQTFAATSGTQQPGRLAWMASTSRSSPYNSFAGGQCGSAPGRANVWAASARDGLAHRHTRYGRTKLMPEERSMNGHVYGLTEIVGTSDSGSGRCHPRRSAARGTYAPRP